MLAKQRLISRLFKEFDIIELGLTLNDALQLSQELSTRVLLEANSSDIISIQMMLSNHRLNSNIAIGSEIRRVAGILTLETGQPLCVVPEELIAKELERMDEFLRRYGRLV